MCPQNEYLRRFGLCITLIIYVHTCIASLNKTNSPTLPSDVLFSTQISSAGAIPGVTAVDTGGIPGGNSIPGGGGMFPMGGGRKGGRWGKREEANEESYQAIQKHE